MQEMPETLSDSLIPESERSPRVSLLDSVGEGECGMIWDNGIETGILSHVK